MPAHSRSVRRIFYLVSFAAVATGCMPKPQPPVAAKLPVSTFKPHDDPQMSKDGVTVTVSPITTQNLRNFPQAVLNTTITVQTPEHDLFGSPTGKTVPVEKQITFSVIPLPAFQVRIVNNTGHIIRLGTSVFRLEDNVGRKYPTFAGSQEILAWAQVQAGGLDAAVQSQLLPKESAVIQNLPLLNRSIELLKGDEWTGYMVFNFGGEPDYYQKLLNSVERLTLRLAEIPVETSESGQVTRTTEFSFVVDKTTDQVDVECPASTSTPSWETCKRVEVASAAR